MKKNPVFLFLMLASLGFSIRVQAQQAVDPNYTLPDSYYQSQNTSAPNSQGTLVVAQASDPQPVSASPVVTQPTPVSETQPAPGAEAVQPVVSAPVPEPTPPEVAAPAGDLPVAGYDGGFFIQDKNGKFKMTINGAMQMQLAGAFVEDSEDGYTLSVRRSSFVFSGHVIDPKLTWAVVFVPFNGVGFAGGGIYYALMDEITFNAGYDSININYLYYLSSGKLDFLTPSIDTQRFNLGDTVGFWLAGTVGKVSYNAGVYNGVFNDLSNNANQELAYGGNVSYQPLAPYSGNEGDPGNTQKVALIFQLGGGFGHYEDLTQAKVIAGHVFTGFKYRGISVAAAGNYRYTDPDQFTLEQTDLGYTVQASYYIIPSKLSFGVRHSALLDDLTDAGVNLNMTGGRLSALKGNFSGFDMAGDSDNEYEYSAALNYDFSGANIRLQSQYALIVDGIPGADDTLSHIVMLQGQVRF